MASRVEEYLRRATECEEKAQSADMNDLRAYFRMLAEHWRMLAEIAMDEPESKQSDSLF